MKSSTVVRLNVLAMFFTFGVAVLVWACASPLPPPAPPAPTVTASVSASALPVAPVKPLAVVACSTPAQLVTDLGAASQASVISLSGVLPLTCPEVPMVGTWAGGKLLFSDSPESPAVRGKLFEDAALPATSGTDYNRVFAYHVNAKASGNMRFTVLIKNTSASSATLTVQKKASAGPSTNYPYTGKVAFERWLNSVASAGVTVAAGATVRLDSTFDSTNVAPTNLLHGIWDYSMTQTHQVTICALNQADNPLTVCPTLAVLPRDTHQRGTCPNADKVYDTVSGSPIDTAAGIQQFPLAGNTPNDPNAACIDTTDGSSQLLAGNFGVLYRIHLDTVSTDAKNLGFLFNPRGGSWGGAVKTLPGLTPGGVFLVPAAAGMTGDNTKGTVEGKYAPGAGLAPWAQFMPTGGSSFPIRMVVVPF